jgi:hypothetical protein
MSLLIPIRVPPDIPFPFLRPMNGGTFFYIFKNMCFHT